jgi:hypothetical protein
VTPKDPARELTELWSRSVPSIVRRIGGLVGAIARGEPTAHASELLADELAQTMALADLIGRRRLLLEADAHEAEASERDLVVLQAEDPIRRFPEVPFVEAIRDLVTREPRLAASAEEVARLYRERHAFALARSAELATTQRVQAILQRASAAGQVARVTAENLIAEAGPFAAWYAQVVYRTNLATANAAGRFQQAREPGVAEVIGGFERWEIMDSDVRRGRPEDHGENHAAGHGLIAGVADPIWRYASAPAGYQCRGGQRFVSRGDLRRLGLLGHDGRVLRRLPDGFAAYRPHPRFAVSPHARIYGGAGIGG